MQRFLALLLRKPSIAIFLIGETIAIYSVIQFNALPRQKTQQWWLAFSAALQNQVHQIYQYFYLHAINEQLIEDNTRLRTALIAQQSKEVVALPKFSSSYCFLDSTFNDSLSYRYRFIPCRVIFQPWGQKDGYFLINKGTLHGIRPMMGVVSPTGVAGVVIKTTKRYALCMSLLNTKLYLSVWIAPQNVLGSYTWDAKDRRHGIVRYVPSHYLISPGQKVYTSGMGTIFPEGIPVGTVTEVVKDPANEAFWRIRIQLATDFYRMDYLYAVEHYDRTHLDSLSLQTP